MNQFQKDDWPQMLEGLETPEVDADLARRIVQQTREVSPSVTFWRELYLVLWFPRSALGFSVCLAFGFFIGWQSQYLETLWSEPHEIYGASSLFLEETFKFDEGNIL